MIVTLIDNSEGKTLKYHAVQFLDPEIKVGFASKKNESKRIIGFSDLWIDDATRMDDWKNKQTNKRTNEWVDEQWMENMKRNA